VGRPDDDEGVTHPQVRPDPAFELLELYDDTLPHIYGCPLARCGDIGLTEELRAREVLDRLGTHHRAALTLRYLDGLPVPEVARYRRPLAAPGDGRLPTLIWPRQIPIAGQPADVHQACADYAAWLAPSPGLPKLFVNAEPGSILTGAVRDFCRTWPVWPPSPARCLKRYDDEDEPHDGRQNGYSKGY
jgi:hypothetical protein